MACERSNPMGKLAAKGLEMLKAAVLAELGHHRTSTSPELADALFGERTVATQMIIRRVLKSLVEDDGRVVKVGNSWASSRNDPPGAGPVLPC